MLSQIILLRKYVVIIYNPTYKYFANKFITNSDAKSFVKK